MYRQQPFLYNNKKLVTLASSMCGFHTNWPSPSLPTGFEYAICCWNVKYDPFLKNIITGDEKWIVYDNIKK